MYRDRWIECTADAIVIRAYYVPCGTKRIPYSAIRSAKPVRLGLVTGRLRIWGTADPRYWAHLDPQRPRKRVGFILDVRGSVRPFLTPDDPDRFAAALRDRVEITAGGRGPII